jgi:hypothetical protein
MYIKTVLKLRIKDCLHFTPAGGPQTAGALDKMLFEPGLFQKLIDKEVKTGYR